MEFTTTRLNETELALWTTAVSTLIPIEDRDKRSLSEESATAALGSEDVFLIVSRVGNDIFGLLSAYRFPDVTAEGSLIYLYDIVVAPSARRQGIGRSLIDCLQKCCEGGEHRIWAGTDVANKPARALFARTGARLEGESYAEYEWKLPLNPDAEQLNLSQGNSSMLLCLAYPRLSKSDSEVIRNFRKEHDLKYVDVVNPHWTMIFPGSSEGIPQDDLVSHIRDIAAESVPVEFTCRYALVYDDDGCDDYYIFLVPDEGFSGISLLHDRLYSDFMRPTLRIDIPYVPHIGIATSKDRNRLYELAAEWNAMGHEINGTLEELTLCSYDGTRVADLKRFPLDSKREQDVDPNA